MESFYLRNSQKGFLLEKLALVLLFAKRVSFCNLLFITCDALETDLPAACKMPSLIITCLLHSLEKLKASVFKAALFSDQRDGRKKRDKCNLDLFGGDEKLKFGVN